MEASPSGVRSFGKAVNDRNQEQRRTRDTVHTQRHTHSIPPHVQSFMHTVKTCMTPCYTHKGTHAHISAVHFQGRTNCLLQRNRKEKQEDTEQKVCSATSNIYSGAAVLSKHYASELLRN